MMDERPFEGWFCREAGGVLGPLSRGRLRQLREKAGCARTTPSGGTACRTAS